MNSKQIKNWAPLLNRAPLPFDEAPVRDALKAKTVLVTGAGGSLGSALARALCCFPLEHLILLDSAEQALYEIDNDVAEGKSGLSHESILGSICDAELLEETFGGSRPHIVLHAAACKHVPLMEQNPFAAAQTNAVGTCLLVNTAIQFGVDEFIMLSTDKAVDPVNIMGATKRIAELILLSHDGRTQMKTVRLGNVLGSSGSVVPLFLEQLARGGPLTVAHPEASRYFLTLDEATHLLLAAVCDTHRGAVLVPQLGDPVLIDDLAKFLISAVCSARFETAIRYTGLRTGDKLREELVSSREIEFHDGPLRAYNSPTLPQEGLKSILREIERACQDRDLEGLLRAVQQAVPEYKPSAALARAADKAKCGASS